MRFIEPQYYKHLSVRPYTFFAPLMNHNANAIPMDLVLSLGFFWDSLMKGGIINIHKIASAIIRCAVQRLLIGLAQNRSQGMVPAHSANLFVSQTLCLLHVLFHCPRFLLCRNGHDFWSPSQRTHKTEWLWMLYSWILYHRNIKTHQLHAFILEYIFLEISIAAQGAAMLEVHTYTGPFAHDAFTPTVFSGGSMSRKKLDISTRTTKKTHGGRKSQCFFFWVENPLCSFWASIFQFASSAARDCFFTHQKT